MTSGHDELIFGAVVAARLILPLLIPKWPLPAILACLVVDGVDQTIFQQYTSLKLDNYQSYDKALDIYYLTIAYLATMRNWTNESAFKVSRFLLFYRLIGVVAFEFTQVRALLLIFPNTFEYFFIFYEGVRTRWDPRRMTTRFVVAAAAFIWIFIKLPQEWWIHIAQLDATDEIKERIFGVGDDASWTSAITNRPWVSVLIVVVAVALAFLIRWIVRTKLPPADHTFRIAADPLPPEDEVRAVVVANRARLRDAFDRAVIEKIVLISLVSIVFAQMLPGVDASPFQVTEGVVVLVVANALISIWFARRGRSISSTALAFVSLAVVNCTLVAVADWLLSRGPGDIRAGETLFFVLLLTLIVTLYDRFQPVARVRFS